MIWIGTSGYNYPEWKGSFYPKDLPAAKMLPYYAARFPTVEINYTFYRMPNEKLVGRLGGADARHPTSSRSRRRGASRTTAGSRTAASWWRRFCRVAGTLGDKLGALLFQLPPNLKKDLRALRRVPGGAAAAGAAPPSSSGTPRGSTTRCSSG